MKRTNIYLNEEQARLLRHLAVEEGRSFTDIVHVDHEAARSLVK